MADKKYGYKQRTWTDGTGKKHVVYGKSEREAADKLAELKRKVKAGEYGVSERMTVRAWSEEWDRVYLKPKIRKAGEDKKRGTMTRKSYEGTYRYKLDGHILPEIGNMRMCDVKPVHLQGIVNEAGELSASHAEKVRLVLNKMFGQAVRSRVIVYNPADGLELPAGKKNSRRSLTAYERDMVMRVAGVSKYGAWIMFLLGTGVRPGESAPLQVRDLDFDAGVVHVYKNIEGGTYRVVSMPKTAAGSRNIPIPDWLLPFLRKAVAGKGPGDYVFPQRDGESMMTTTVIRKYWLSFLRELDLAMGAETTHHGHIYDPKDLKGNGEPIYPDPSDPKKPQNGHRVAPDLVLYCLRHTYCTDLQRAGVPLNIAKYLMGHTDIATTAAIYTHTGDYEVAQAKELINKYDAGAVPGKKNGSKKISGAETA